MKELKRLNNRNQVNPVNYSVVNILDGVYWTATNSNHPDVMEDISSVFYTRKTDNSKMEIIIDEEKLGKIQYTPWIAMAIHRSL